MLSLYLYYLVFYHCLSLLSYFHCSFNWTICILLLKFLFFFFSVLNCQQQISPRFSHNRQLSWEVNYSSQGAFKWETSNHFKFCWVINMLKLKTAICRNKLTHLVVRSVNVPILDQLRMNSETMATFLQQQQQRVLNSLQLRFTPLTSFNKEKTTISSCLMFGWLWVRTAAGKFVLSWKHTQLCGGECGALLWRQTARELMGVRLSADLRFLFIYFLVGVGG